MTTPRVLKYADHDVSDGPFAELLHHVELSSPVVAAPPVPVAVRGLGGGTGQVLRGIRAVLVFCAFMLACLVMMLGAIAHGMGALGNAQRLAGPVALQISVPGPDPAADYYAHVRFADGTERDLQVGSFLVDPIVAVEFAVQAGPESETSCRIAIDGVRVAQMTAAADRTATCRWSAP